MRLKFDENLPAGLVEKLSRLGHDVETVPSENLTGRSDPDVWAAAQQDQRFFVTQDLIWDGDGLYGRRVRRRIESLGIEEVVTAPASPWQNAYVERVIGTLRRELLDHVIILNERHLKRLLSSYLEYYHPWCTHRSLAQDAPDGRPVRVATPCNVVEFRAVHGLHHVYVPKAA